MSLSDLIHDTVGICSEAANLRKQQRLNRLYSRENGARPLVFVRPTRVYLRQKYALDLQLVYQDPQEYLKTELLTKLQTYMEFDDDTPVWPLVEMWLGSPFEMSLLGTECIMLSESDPRWGAPVLRSLDDVAKLRQPDFESTGMLPLAHRMYGDIEKLVSGRFEVRFPQWQKGTLGVALVVRGDSDFYADLYDNPEGLHRLMSHIDRVAAWYEEERNKRFGVSKGDGRWGYRRYRTLGNDEVDCNLISPAHYLEFVYPYDRSYTERSAEGVYLHSCGNLTPLYRQIAALPHLEVLHISPWSDFFRALDVVDKSIILEKAFYQQDSYFQADVNKMAEEIDNLVRAAREAGRLFYFLVDADVFGDKENKRLQEWLRVCRESIARHYGEG